MGFLDDIKTTNEWDFKKQKAREGYDNFFGVYKARTIDAFGTESKGGAKYVHLDVELIDKDTGEIVGTQGFDLYLTSGKEKGQKDYFEVTIKDRDGKEKKVPRKFPAWNILGSILSADLGIENAEQIKDKLNEALSKGIDTKKKVFGEEKVVSGLPELIDRKFSIGLAKEWDDYNGDFRPKIDSIDIFDAEPSVYEKMEKSVERANKRAEKNAEKDSKSKEQKSSNTENKTKEKKQIF